MGRWLEKIKIVNNKELTKPTKLGFVSFVGRSQSVSEKNSINLSKYKFPTIAEVREFLGDDWGLYSHNYKAIDCWRTLMVERMMMDRGITPADYTEATCCEYCGTVYVLPGMGSNGRVLGCPWCYSKFRQSVNYYEENKCNV